jgi:beta-lactamase superfamily II metal-dependent hydrolase
LANKKQPSKKSPQKKSDSASAANKTNKNSGGKTSRIKNRGGGINGVALLFVILAAFAAFGIYLERNSETPTEFTAKAVAEAPRENVLEVSFIDVGQGQSILINDGENAVLIDGGEAEYGETVCSFIKESGVKKLDMIIASHPHSDHIGGLPDVIENIKTDELVFPVIPNDKTPTTKIYENLLDAAEEYDLSVFEVSAGDVFDINEMHFTVLSPEKGADFNDLNDYSAVIMLSFGDTRWLFTGDAEKPAEKIMTESGFNLSADVLAVGHHGSANSSTEAFLEKTAPQIAVISCGKDNDYGHPTDEALSRLGEYAKEIYRTDLDGTVTFKTNGVTIYKVKQSETESEENDYS